MKPESEGYRISQLLTASQWKNQGHTLPDTANDDEPAPVLHGKYGQRVKDEQLQVTYDSGSTWKTVPNGVALLSDAWIGETYLQPDPTSYVIADDFTAFIGLHEVADSETSTVELIYSFDEATTWNVISVANVGDEYGTCILSVAGGNVHATFSPTTFEEHSREGDISRVTTLEKLRGTSSQDDSSIWETLKLPGDFSGGVQSLTIADWVNANDGFIGRTGQLYYTDDGGKTFASIEIPHNTDLANRLGEDPFDTPIWAYSDKGKAYVVFSQGPDGDYTKHGRLQEAIYSFDTTSKQFTFVREADAFDPNARN